MLPFGGPHYRDGTGSLYFFIAARPATAGYRRIGLDRQSSKKGRPAAHRVPCRCPGPIKCPPRPCAKSYDRKNMFGYHLFATEPCCAGSNSQEAFGVEQSLCI